MLRTLTGSRRKFSFDLALHRSREKKEGPLESGGGVVNAPVESVRPSTPSRRSAEEEERPSRSYSGPAEGEESRQSWLRARKRATSPTTTTFKPKPERRGRVSARGDDAPRIRDISREGRTPRRTPRRREEEVKDELRTPKREVSLRSEDDDDDDDDDDWGGGGGGDSVASSVPRSESNEPLTKDRKSNTFPPPPPPAESPLKQTPNRGPPKTPESSLSSSTSKQQKQTGSRTRPRQPRKPLVLQDPPSWQQLKAKALEADYSSMADFIENYHTRAQVGRSATMNNSFSAAAASKTQTTSSSSTTKASSSSSSSSGGGFFGGVAFPSSPSWGGGSSRERGRRAADVASLSTPPQRSASATRAPATADKKKDDAPTFEKWFTDRFPENQISSAPAAHKALWAEHERQARFKRVEGRRKSNDGLAASDTASSYLDRLRLGTSTAKANARRLSDGPADSSGVWPDLSASSSSSKQQGGFDNKAPAATPGSKHLNPFKSGSVESPGRVLDARQTTLHVVTWRVERWSALPSGFRQGARYRPPGGNAWSLDLYKGGIKRERPGMVALYVHYDPPRDDAFATVTSLELSLMNQTTGAHLMRKHEGTRVFGPKADPARRVSTSAGTASLAHLVLTQVEALGFCLNDTVVLRAEIEVLAGANYGGGQGSPRSPK
eukprot:CAMPEP_0118896010 /NCGR_PEP_ID=MMETSP1166-20130328/4085_1 /TAXON_ID=1104430 /ORGANISM="Chrysoreinhardia sp, Strain CCMP3193" /LENGTH=665 /DNA_ID=CAMNT_0006835061 /DNA_START=88 /DNA_END=2085 /DNA_ORIENTATION=+